MTTRMTTGAHRPHPVQGIAPCTERHIVDRLYEYWLVTSRCFAQARASSGPAGNLKWPAPALLLSRGCCHCCCVVKCSDYEAMPATLDAKAVAAAPMAHADIQKASAAAAAAAAKTARKGGGKRKAASGR